MKEPTTDETISSRHQPSGRESTDGASRADTVWRRGRPGPELGDLSGLSRDELLDRLCDDQVRRWNAGQRVPAEAYLAQHPTLQDESEAAFELIYGEYLLREERGESPTPEEFHWRFPRYADRLARQLELHAVLNSGNSPATTIADAPRHGGAADGDRPVRSAALAPGYEILAELGRGGMGAVYKAWQFSLKRVVALKLIRADAYANAGAAARFHGEAEAAARFQHPNIVHVYEVGEHEGSGFLVLEYVAGGGLDRKLSGSLQDPHDSARLIETLARAIHYAHQRGIVHRDLKPANVLLTEDGVPKITDFGLAKLLERDQALTQVGELLGTPSYMAPEQIRGLPHQITPATDVYALGAILYEMLTGRPPFKGTTPLSTLEQVSSHEPLSPSKIQRHVPRDLETICLKCLAKDPRRRYNSAQELADDLRRFLDRQPILARPTPPWERAWKWARRRPGAATALVFTAAAVLLAAVVGVYYNARLRAAVQTARAAERAADASASAALEERNLALKALKQLVFDVQERLGQTPATRSLRQSLLDTAIAGLEEIARSAAGAPPDLNQAVAHQKLGDIFRIVNRSADARRHYDRSRQFAEALLAANPADLPAAEDLYQSSMGLGLLCITSEQYDEAKIQMRHVVDIAEQMGANPAFTGSRQELIEAYLQLGRAHSFAREYPAAEGWFRKMQDLAAQWVALEPKNNQAKDLLASSYRKLADLKKFALDLAGARQDYLRAMAIARQVLADEPGNATFKANLGVALDDLAGVALDQREPGEARDLYRQAEQLFLQLVEADPEHFESLSKLLRTRYNVARLEEAESHYPQAGALFRTVLEEVSRLKRAGRLEDRRDAFANTKTLANEVAFCEAAPRALADMDFVRSQPAAVAARLLLLKASSTASEQDAQELKKVGETLLALQPDTPDDAYDVARHLALLISELRSSPSSKLASSDRQSLIDRCTDRAVQLLRAAIARGLRDPALLQSGELAPLHQHPGFKSLLASLKPPPVAPDNPVKTSE
jgi:tetratricopeptide (TPR) repeat protein/predicted Ser/Thr protein kinase